MFEPAVHSELVCLTLALAYSCARSDIELLCPLEAKEPSAGNPWWITQSSDADDQHVVDRAVRYLELRQLLNRHPTREDLVQVIDAPANHQYPRPS
jgi:hypothetical protein